MEMNLATRAGNSRRIKTSEQIARKILNEIRRRGMKPGEMLPDESTMLTQHKVSRGSLREALRLLEQHGMIHLKPGPGGGPMVGGLEAVHVGRMLSLFLSVTETTYNDLVDFLLIIYPLTARRAAEHASEVQIAELLAHSDDLDKETVPTHADRDHADFRPMAVSRFHFLLEEVSGNPVYSLFIDAIRSIIAEHVVATTDERVFDCSHAEHLAIAERISARDGEGASALMYAHVAAVIDRHRRTIPGIFDASVRW